MRYTIILLPAFLFLFYFQLNAQQRAQSVSRMVTGTKVRGQIVIKSYRTASPYKSAKVDLYYRNNAQAGGNWTKAMTTYTDVNGTYYFSNVSQSQVLLKVNDAGSYNITINRNEQYQDLPQIVINFVSSQRAVRQ